MLKRELTPEIFHVIIQSSFIFPSLLISVVLHFVAVTIFKIIKFYNLNRKFSGKIHRQANQKATISNQFSRLLKGSLGHRCA